METEIFKKVYIRDCNDLPKEAGFYFVNWTPGHAHNTTMGVVYYDESIKGLWFGKGWFDWYLLPVPLPSEEEIEEEVLKFNRTESLCTVDYYSTGFVTGVNWLKSRLTDKSKDK